MYGNCKHTNNFQVGGFEMKPKIVTPFFSVSPKSYLIGQELLDLALIADKLAGEMDSTVFFTAPPTELANIVKSTKNMIVTSQSADGLGVGKGMGRLLLESLKEIGVKATFINHVEAPLTFKELIAAIDNAKKLDIISIVCVDTAEEARIISYADPDVILCEPNYLIGTGKTSDESYVHETIEEIKKVNPDILIMEGAGITSGSDVSRIIKLGADGTGVSSILTKDCDKKELLKDLFSGLK